MKQNEHKNEKENKEIEYSEYNTSASSKKNIIYKYSREVIGIAPEADFHEENLDAYHDYHHVDATLKISEKLGVKLTKTISPYEAGVEASKNGLVIMQLSGNFCMLYLPATITQFQKTTIQEELFLRKDFSFSLSHNQSTLDYVDLEYIMKFLDSITTSKKR